MGRMLLPLVFETEPLLNRAFAACCGGDNARRSTIHTAAGRIMGTLLN
jgi:hypothetical protein